MGGFDPQKPIQLAVRKPYHCLIGHATQIEQIDYRRDSTGVFVEIRKRSQVGRLTDAQIGFLEHFSAQSPLNGLIPIDPPLEPEFEQLTTQKDITLNEMFGGQIGFRYFKPHNRYVLSTDFRAFFGGNWQSSKFQTITEFTEYDGIGVDSEVTSMSTVATNPIYTRNSEFYYGYDVRAELSYQLTRMFSVRAGMQAIQIGRGLWRGGEGRPNTLAGGAKDQGLFMFGATFGMNFNH